MTLGLRAWGGEERGLLATRTEKCENCKKSFTWRGITRHKVVCDATDLVGDKSSSTIFPIRSEIFEKDFGFYPEKVVSAMSSPLLSTPELESPRAKVMRYEEMNQRKKQQQFWKVKTVLKRRAAKIFLAEEVDGRHSQLTVVAKVIINSLTIDRKNERKSTSTESVDKIHVTSVWKEKVRRRSQRPWWKWKGGPVKWAGSGLTCSRASTWAGSDYRQS